jgi:hypothetical protein|nr:MAG TPA: hypothetical protein [Caudoviricetes sp.]
MYYLSKRDNATKIKVDEGYSNENTVMIEYLNGPKQGKAVPITRSTLKRWWKKVEQENTSVQMPSTEKLENVKNVCPIKKTTKKIDRTEDVEKIVKMLIDDYVYKYYDSVNCYKVYDIMAQNHVIAEIYPQRKKIVCYLRSLEGMDLSKTIFHKQGYKYYLPCRADISYDDDFISILKNFL